LLLSATPAFSADAPPDYVKAVMTQVAARVEYPKMAKMRHQEGTVTVQITVDDKGQPTATTVAQSSGIQSLDDAALDAVKVSAPFPAPPATGTVVKGNVKFTAD
jgi:TonB family protein